VKEEDILYPMANHAFAAERANLLAVLPDREPTQHA